MDGGWLGLQKEACVGCGACAAVCPVSAIEMAPDAEGFAYPRITAACIDCGQCEARCPVCAGYDRLYTAEASPLAVNAAWSRDGIARGEGSSGGVFGALARAVLEQGGHVAGAAFTPEHRARHRLIHHARELPALQKSKYLQSDMDGVYTDTEKLLRRQETVLFAGTPCQCAGMLAFLGGPDEHLILCDFVCHGVNSPLVHQRYMEDTERSLGIAVRAIDHRSKRTGWRDFRFVVSDGTDEYELGDQKSDPFLRGFLTNLYLRPACYQCRFKGVSRPTDITLGDCWGYPGREDDGVSLALLHSEKGRQLWEMAAKDLHRESYPLERAIEYNSPLLIPVADRGDRRASFFSAFASADGTVGEIVARVLGEE